MKKLLMVGIFVSLSGLLPAIGLSNPETVGECKQHYTWQALYMYVVGVVESSIALQGMMERQGLNWVMEDFEKFRGVVMANLTKYKDWKTYIVKLLEYIRGLPASSDGDLLLRWVTYAKL